MLGSIIAILLFIALIIVLFDFYDDFYNWFMRIKIGQKSDYNEWAEAVRSINIKWALKGAPEVSANENQRLKLVNLIKNLKKDSSIKYWQDAALLKGISFEGGDADQKASEKMMERYIDVFTGEWKRKPVNVDAAMLSYELMSCKYIDNKVIEPAMNYIADMLKVQFETYGTIPYNTGIADIRFVDTVGMTCPFLIKYANEYNHPEYIDIAFEQIKQYRKNGFDDKNGLPFHCFNVETEAQLGICGWGRGCGWWAVGIVDSLKELVNCDGLNKEKAVLLKLNIEFLDRMKKYVQTNGAVSRMVLNESLYDSSASAMFAYCYSYLYSITKKDDYKETADRIIEYLISVTRRNGVIDFSQGDTMGIGFYAAKYSVVPAAQGFTMAAINYKK